jgi:hypothetical protein
MQGVGAYVTGCEVRAAGAKVAALIAYLDDSRD